MPFCISGFSSRRPRQPLVNRAIRKLCTRIFCGARLYSPARFFRPQSTSYRYGIAGSNYKSQRSLKDLTNQCISDTFISGRQKLPFSVNVAAKIRPEPCRKMQTECPPGMKSAKTDSAAIAKRSFKLRGANARSKVTNGVRLLPGLDGRSTWSRRFHDLVSLHAQDAGGVDSLSEAQVSLIRRAAALEVTLENLELDMACGREVDLDQYSRCAGHLRRILETVGIRRVAREVSPSLADIIAGHRSKSPEKSVQTPKPPIAADTESRMDAPSAPRDGAIPARKEAE